MNESHDNPIASSANVKSNYIYQIDYIKAACIVAVIIIHTLSMFNWWLFTSEGIVVNALFKFGEFHIDQAVPIFFILMGLNMGMWLLKSRKDESKSIYSRKYFANRFWRVLIPFLFIFLISTILWYIYNRSNSFPINVFYLWGLLPISGPGNYFLSIIFQFVLLFPLLFGVFNKFPRVTLILTFSITLSFEIFANYSLIFDSYPYLYQACILRYLFPITLGIWLIADMNIFSKRNRIVTILGLVSLVYMIILISIPGWTISSPYGFSAHKPMFSLYAILLVLIGIWLLPKHVAKPPLMSLSIIGRASFHIYLAQEMYFAFLFWQFSSTGSNLINGISPDIASIVILIWNIFICILLGVLFFVAERRFTKWLQGRLKANLT